MSAPMRFIRRLVKHRQLIPVYARSMINGLRCGAELRDLQAYCMFTGYPRSGHSLIGSLLTAHRHMVIAHELDALQYVTAGFSRAQLAALILRQDTGFTTSGRQWEGYSYEVPDQWQGRYEKLLVIGDKKGHDSNRRLATRPWLLDRLRRTMRVPVKIIHHVRNPYDNISTMMLKGDQPTLPLAIEAYFELCANIERTRNDTPDEDFMDVQHEAFLAEPKEQLGAIVEFLGLETDEDYLEACRSVVFKSPKQSRHNAPWTDELIRDVGEQMQSYSFLKGYCFDS